LIQRPNRPIFLYVGRISDSEKNISFMLKGLSRLKHKDCQLKIVGAGPDEEKLKKLAEKLGISDRVSWLGFRKDPYSEFKEITALLLTSRYEGFPMVLVEANQRGIPVISSDCESGPKDIVTAGVNGYLYREGDMDEFVRIVSDVIDGRLSFDTPENIAKTAERFREDVVVENIYRALRETVTN
jgi:UDP-D-galactose:(glucosyl)LPS alpha-1,6-D-galactosyltransferase